MKKIAIDCYKLEETHGAERAGVGRQLYRLLEEVTKRPELAERYCFYLYFKGRIPEEIPFLDNPVFVKKIAKFPFFLPFLRPSFNIYFHLALPLFALRDRIDITFFPSFMLPAFFMTKAVVVIPNDIIYELTRGNLPFRYKLSYKLFTTWAAKRAIVTTQTHASKKEISKYFKIKEDKIKVIPLGADFENLSRKENITKKEYIFYLGQAFPRRHLKETLEAFEKIAPEFPNLKFNAVGLDKYNPPIIDKLVDDINGRLGENRITRYEFIDDEELGRMFREALIFTYISSSEAMGLPPLEALATGTAPVVADTPTTREIFEDNAFFVSDPDNPENIAEVLREALRDDKKRDKILQGRERILEKYTWKRHTDKMIKLFEKETRR